MEPPHSANKPPHSATPPEFETLISDLMLYLGARPEMPDRSHYLFFLTASLVFLLGMLAFLGYIYLDPVRERLYQMILNKERIRTIIDSAGSWGPLLFLAFQALLVVLLVSFLPVEIVGGFIFGLPLGLLYSTLGLTLGALLAFLLARRLERKYVSRWVHPDTMKRYRRLMKREGTLTAFLLFLIPGFPKDVICYLLGLSRMSLGFFLVAVTMARLPSTLFLTLQGTQAYKGNYGVTLGLIALYAVLLILLYRHRRALYRWVERWHPEED